MVLDLEDLGRHVERELALVKVLGVGDKRVEALRIADLFRARLVDSTTESFVFEMTGTPEKIDAFADLMRPLGLREIARTGVAALSRGA
jgi:acetolactate synthase-1/3 small subunit